ncbi:MAG: histidine phosphatase family protein [Planctomycetota bacterium]
MSGAPELVAVRHAEVTARWSGRCYGAIDVEVQPGAAEAAALVLPLLERAPSQLWTSPLERCRSLAEELAAELDVPLTIDDSLTEVDHGAFEGRAWDDIHAEQPAELARWGEHWRDEGPPGGESARALEARIRAWHDRLSNPPARHLLVAHAGAVRALRVVREGLEWEAAMASRVPHLIPLALPGRDFRRLRREGPGPRA